MFVAHTAKRSQPCRTNVLQNEKAIPISKAHYGPDKTDSVMSGLQFREVNFIRRGQLLIWNSALF